MDNQSFRVSYTFRGTLFSASFQESDPEVHQLGLKIQKDSGASFETLKLLGPGLKGALVLSTHAGKSCQEAGLVHGKQYMLLGSSDSDVRQVKEAKDMPGLLGFDGEVKRAAQRKRTRANAKVGPPGGEYTFGDYKVLNLPNSNPSPSEALKMLYRLASDPGIVGIMTQRKWKVGLLSEMPPEGRVGVSEVCVLGYNVNKGQEIALRLRTDDLKGLRKYKSIRDTLVHELTHMVWSDHDINFKMLNSELSKECERLNAQSMSGSFLGGDFLGKQSMDDMDWEEEDDAKVKDGQKLGGNTSTPAAPRLAAREAAIRRMGDTSAQSIAVTETPQATADAPGNSAAASSRSKLTTNGEESTSSSGGYLQKSPEVLSIDVGQSPASESRQGTVPGGGQPSKEHLPSGSQRSSDHSGEIPGVFPESDPAAERVRRARSAVDQLLEESSTNALVALQTVAKVLQNALDHPEVEKFRSLRMGNQGFHRRVGQFRNAVELMKLVGFVEEGDPLNSVLTLKRQDPGLLWLGLSVVKEGIERLS